MGMIETYRNPYKPEDVADPQWETVGRVHDWRNYIGEKTRALWATLSVEQQLAIAQDADAQAGGEQWD